MSYYRNMLKYMDDTEKLELVSIIIDSMKREQSNALRPYTMDEINAMIDESEGDIAEGRVCDFDEAMDELEREFATEDRKIKYLYFHKHFFAFSLCLIPTNPYFCNAIPLKTGLHYILFAQIHVVFS